MAAAFSSGRVFEQPLELAILEEYWQDTDFTMGCLHANVPMPGALMQCWHRDGGAESDAARVTAPVRTWGIGVKLPLCDADETNGSIEVVPGSHRLVAEHSYATEQHAPPASPEDGDGKGADYNMLLIHDAFAGAVDQPEHTLPPQRVNMQRGDMWLMDHRIFHRGTAVDADAPGR